MLHFPFQWERQPGPVVFWSHKATASSVYSAGMKPEQALWGSYVSRAGFGGCGDKAAPFWEVSFREGGAVGVSRVAVDRFGRRLRNVRVVLLGEDRQELVAASHVNPDDAEGFTVDFDHPVEGTHYVRLEKVAPLQNGDDRSFNLNAVGVFGSLGEGGGKRKESFPS